MKKQKSAWWQPQGWMSSGTYVVVGLVVLYLLFMVIHYIAPRVRGISKIYNSACIVRMLEG